MNPVLETTKYIIDNSKHVKINFEKIKEFCTNVDHIHIKHWLEEAPFDLSHLSDDQKLNFLLFFNSISFSYWGNPKWTVEHNGKEYDGSWGMIIAMGRAIEENKPILDINYLSKISKEEFGDLLRANIEIPLFEERWKIIRKVSTILSEKFNGEFKNVVELAKGDAIKLLKLIVSNFSSFDDSSIYKDKKVHFYKRAQLLVSDIYQLFKGKGYGNLKNINKLTACADYKVPMVLRKLGIISYSEELAQKIDNKIEIPKDSDEENEIRASTIWATEYIKDKLKEKLPDVDSIHVNDHLWLVSQVKSPDDKPYHLIRTMCY